LVPVKDRFIRRHPYWCEIPKSEV